MRLSRVLFYLFLCFFSSFSAQQEPLISNFWNIQPYYLPATTGLENEREAVILARDQWIGITGHPRTLQAQYQQQLAKINSGFGLTLMADKIGFNHNQTAKLSYAYHLPLGERQTVSFGANLSLLRIAMRPEWETPTPTADPSLLGDTNMYRLFPDFGFNYKLSKWQIGLGVTRVNFYNKFGNGFNIAPHYFLQSGYTFSVGEQLEITPRILIQTDLVKMTATFNVQFKINDWIQVGALMRNSLFGGVNLNFLVFKNYYFGYTAELFSIKNYKLFYSHEAVVGFRLPTKSKE